MTSLSTRDIAALILTAAIWGFNFVAIVWVVDEVPPILAAATRFFLVAFPLVLFLPRPKTDWWRVFLIGLFISVLQFGLLFLAIRLGLEGGIASLVMQSQVLFSIVLGYLLFNERITKKQALGIVIAAIGFGYFFLSRLDVPLGVVPLVVAIAGAFFWACGNMVFRTIKTANPVHVNIYAAMVAPLPLLALSLIFETHEPMQFIFAMSLKAWISMFFIAYVSTIVAYSIWAQQLSRHSAAVVTPFALLVPFFGIFGAWLALGEKITLAEIIAAVIVIIGLGLLVIRPKKIKAAIDAG